jgi:hypothetical protein
MEVNDKHNAQADLHPEGKSLCIYCTGGWMAPRPGLDVETIEKGPTRCRESKFLQSVGDTG